MAIPNKFIVFPGAAPTELCEAIVKAGDGLLFKPESIRIKNGEKKNPNQRIASLSGDRRQP